ncbi:uncharacterized protein LOC115222046 [Octopus sinensis]|uniref:Uncharacterized protein LOC115222046 n=1 Tax=Octopus sinensis TaxID=2607531 RepID=A0A6P7TER4_9MOLL|nr:uncharacterized protein LOC115222046 [Octopus sinensis]
MEAVERRSMIRFLSLKGCTPKESFDELKEVYGDDVASYDVVKHWYRQFKCGRTSVETIPTAGRRHSAIDDDAVHKVEAAILKARCITIRQVAPEVKISVGSMEKNHSRPFALAEAVCTMDFPDARTFSETERSQLPPGSFGNVPRKRGRFFEGIITEDETGALTRVLRLKSSRSNGSITHHLLRRLLSNPQQAR